MSDALPISVLTGFLGSGKTSFLRRMLASPDMAETAIIINEFGAVSLDHLLVQASSDEVVQLASGCLCCALRGDLVRTLHDLLARRGAGDLPPFRRLAIETSGLAEPAPILYTLAADPWLEQALRFDTLLTLVDALTGLATLERYPEATAQAVLADRLLLTKTDLAPAPPALVERLGAINPAAPIEDAGGVPRPEAALFANDPNAPRRPLPRRLWSAPTHAHGIATVTIALRRPMARLDFARALGGLARDRGEDLLRVKGLVEFADDPGHPAAIHAVQHTLYPPEWFDAWPDDDRMSRLVFITRGIGPGEIVARFDAGDSILVT
jgi:G3E family GTPase